MVGARLRISIRPKPKLVTLTRADWPRAPAALLATWLFVGWFPLAARPAGVRSAGLGMTIGHSWDSVMQAVIDPGWYGVEVSASRPMRVFRYTILVIFSGIMIFVLWPWLAADARVPVIRTSAEPTVCKSV
jgi:hypothetical protein